MDNGTGLTRLSIIKTANMKCKKNKVKWTSETTRGLKYIKKNKKKGSRDLESWFTLVKQVKTGKIRSSSFDKHLWKSHWATHVFHPPWTVHVKTKNRHNFSITGMYTPAEGKQGGTETCLYKTSWCYGKVIRKWEHNFCRWF